MSAVYFACCTSDGAEAHSGSVTIHTVGGRAAAR